MSSGRIFTFESIVPRGYRVMARALILENKSNVGKEMKYELYPIPDSTSQDKKEMAVGLRKLADALDSEAALEEELEEFSGSFD